MADQAGTQNPVNLKVGVTVVFFFGVAVVVTGVLIAKGICFFNATCVLPLLSYLMTLSWTTILLGVLFLFCFQILRLSKRTPIQTDDEFKMSMALSLFQPR